MMRTLILLAAATAVVLPQTASAQACIGLPLKPNEFAIEGNVALRSDVTGYGANIDGRLGRVTVGGGYMLNNYHDTEVSGHTVAAFTAIELPTTAVSVCPVAQVQYSLVSIDPLDVSAFTVMPGIGVGHRFGLEPARGSESRYGLTLYAVPSLAWTRTEVSVSGLDESETNTEFAAETGLTFDTGPFYVGALVQFTTTDDSDPAFGVRTGVRLPTG